MDSNPQWRFAKLTQQDYGVWITRSDDIIYFATLSL
jgi:hypothetical protein